MSRSKIFAIDPGLSGAWAVLGHQNEFLGGDELPRFTKLINGVELANILRSFAPESFVIESVSAMPGQGVSSTFRFGAAFGVAIGVACGFGCPITFVSASRWKNHFRLSGKPKDASRECAIRLFPVSAPLLKRKKDHNLADAILLARFFVDMEAQGEFV